MSRFEPLGSEAPLIVYIDFKSPYAYIAKDPTRALEEELQIEVDWRPLTLDIPSYLGSARLDSRGKLAESRRSPQQWTAVRYAYRDARRYAALRGHTLRGTTKIWDSSLAAIGLLFAKPQGRRVLRSYVDRVYERFWRRELDIEDPAVVEEQLLEAGAEVAGFGAYLVGEGRALHDEMQTAIFDAGIFGVPSYVVAGEALFGREQLPRVRWLLGGRRGREPDIAYERVGAAVPEPVSASSSEPLPVCIDFKSPHAWLAVAPTLALAAELGVSIEWLPWIGRPLAPPAAAGDDDDRGTRHRRFRSENAARDIERAARIQGLEIRDLYRQPDSSLAGLGLLWAGRHDPEVQRGYLERVFEGYWNGQLDLEDPAAIRAALGRAGAELAGWDAYAAGEGPDELEAVQARLQEAGVFDVPSYRVGDEIFLGRQHLPMVRWLRSGRQGEPPI
jgi:2-hydroxychromene-2-carboxylate isomerase